MDFRKNMQDERERLYAEILGIHFNHDFTGLKIMEIGAGTGTNIHFFCRTGFLNANIFANELSDARFEILSGLYPGIQLFKGEASQLDFVDEFDIVMQSTVFSSILDHQLKIKLAAKMFEMVKPEGLILWYDFKYNNPVNSHVKGINKREIAGLFPVAKKIEFKNVTLAPPIGRKVGRYYHVINWLFPFLRSHLIAIIHK